MKALLGIAGIYLVSVAAASALIITFDDLSPAIPGLPGITIPANYDGLQWSGFQGRDGETTGFLTNPYHNAVVSPDNVAGNIDGRPAMINSSSTFDLVSAYLTAVSIPSLQLEVQGFVGTTLAYDNTYLLHESGPALIDFNYAGIDEVKFITSGGIIPLDSATPIPGIENFALDNLNVNIPDAGATDVLLGAALVGLGTLRKVLAQPHLKLPA